MSDDEIPKLPVHYVAARRALAKCRSIEQVKKKHDEASGLAVYAFKAKDRQLMENAAVVKRLAVIELNRRLAEKKRAGKLAKGTRGQLRGAKPGKRGRPGSLLAGSSRPRQQRRKKTLRITGLIRRSPADPQGWRSDA